MYENFVIKKYMQNKHCLLVFSRKFNLMRLLMDCILFVSLVLVCFFITSYWNILFGFSCDILRATFVYFYIKIL